MKLTLLPTAELKVMKSMVCGTKQLKIIESISSILTQGESVVDMKISSRAAESSVWRSILAVTIISELNLMFERRRKSFSPDHSPHTERLRYLERPEFLQVEENWVVNASRVLFNRVT